MDKLTIPPPALEAAYDARRAGGTLEDICIAMLRAWPGMEVRQMYSVWSDKHGIILPMPQEPANDHP